MRETKVRGAIILIRQREIRLKGLGALHEANLYEHGKKEEERWTAGIQGGRRRPPLNSQNRGSLEQRFWVLREGSDGDEDGLDGLCKRSVQRGE